MSLGGKRGELRGKTRSLSLFLLSHKVPTQLSTKNLSAFQYRLLRRVCVRLRRRRPFCLRYALETPALYSGPCIRGALCREEVKSYWVDVTHVPRSKGGISREDEAQVWWWTCIEFWGDSKEGDARAACMSMRGSALHCSRCLWYHEWNHFVILSLTLHNLHNYPLLLLSIVLSHCLVLFSHFLGNILLLTQ